MYRSKFFTGAVASVLILASTGCTLPGTFVMLGSKTSHGSKTDEVQLPKKYNFESYQALVTQVAQTQKFNVSTVDRNTGTIGLAQNTSMLKTVALGPSRNVQLQTVLQPDGKTVALSLTVIGNQSSYKQEKLDAVLASFKEALIASAR